MSIESTKFCMNPGISKAIAMQACCQKEMQHIQRGIMADLAFLQHRLECVDNPEESRAGWHAFLHSRFWHISFYR